MGNHRRRLIALSGFALLSGGLGSLGVESWETGTDRLQAGRVRVATANLHYQNQQKELLARRVSAVGADILVLLECTTGNTDLEALRRENLSVLIDWRARGPEGICVLSSKTLDSIGEIVESPVEGPCQMPIGTIRLRTRRGWISLVAVHSPPPVPRCLGGNYETIAKIASWIDQGTLVQSVGVCRKNDPVMLVGDLNAFPSSRAVRSLRNAGLIDAYARTNWRPGLTWSPRSWLPAVARIDYIMVPDGVEVRDGGIVNLPGSDHKMVWADLY